MPSKLFKKRLEKIPAATKRFVKRNIQIVDQIYSILEKKEMTQKDLSKRLGKSEAEISKWLSGTHNITLKSLAKIEAILGEEIITTPLQVQENPEKYLPTETLSTTKKVKSNVIIQWQVYVEQAKYKPIQMTKEHIPAKVIAV